MQHVLIEGHIAACSIDLHYLSAARCRRMQSSRPAQDSRREPSVTKFSSHSTNTAAAAAMINGTVYVTAQLALSPPWPPGVFLPRYPVVELSPLLSLLESCRPFPAMIIFDLCYMLPCSNPRTLRWGRYIKMTQWRPSFVAPLRFAAAITWFSVKLWETGAHASDDLVKHECPGFPADMCGFYFQQGIFLNLLLVTADLSCGGACGGPCRSGGKDSDELATVL